MRLININLYAEGYYSGSTYEENRWVRADSYEKIKEALPEEIYCGELDGKHSEVSGDIEIQDDFNNDEDLEMAGDGACDGDRLRDVLADIYQDHNLDFDSEEKEIEEYLNSLDRYVEVTVNIPQSKRDELYKFVDDLKRMKE